MSLHARQVAIAAGASGELIEKIAARMVAERTIRIDRAEELLREFTSNPSHEG
jgi:hydroxymethylglutaryl-CoA reductase